VHGGAMSQNRGEMLRERLREIRETMSQDHAIRLHRAVSWLRCAEQYADTDEDVGFVALWIAFNSCYSADDGFNHTFRSDFEVFAQKLVARDVGQQIYTTLWMNYSGFIRVLIDNRHVYQPFWESQRNGDDRWEASFNQNRKFALRALANNDVPRLLSIVMERLYVLRNQIVHGGSTWQSGVNREQVRDGKRVLLELVPLFIELMFDESEDWGKIFYPVVGA